MKSNISAGCPIKATHQSVPLTRRQRRTPCSRGVATARQQELCRGAEGRELSSWSICGGNARMDEHTVSILDYPAAYHLLHISITQGRSSWTLGGKVGPPPPPSPCEGPRMGLDGPPIVGSNSSPSRTRLPAISACTSSAIRSSLVLGRLGRWWGLGGCT